MVDIAETTDVLITIFNLIDLGQDVWTMAGLHASYSKQEEDEQGQT